MSTLRVTAPVTRSIPKLVHALSKAYQHLQIAVYTTSNCIYVAVL
jgi:hypothetical protein